MFAITRANGQAKDMKRFIFPTSHGWTSQIQTSQRHSFGHPSLQISSFTVALLFTSLLAELMTIAQRHSHGFQLQTFRPQIRFPEFNILAHQKMFNSTD
jgi:hypothetical protein